MLFIDSTKLSICVILFENEIINIRNKVCKKGESIMTLHQLEYFQAVACHQHYHKAAEELNISQPSLSRSMALLEDELHIILFEKQGRNIVLTKAGRVFLDQVNKILDEIRITEKKMHELANSEGHISIAYVYPLANHYIPHIVRSFLDENAGKNITFQFNQSYTKKLIEGLKSNEFDIIFGSACDNEPDIHFSPIMEQEMVVIMPKNHPLTKLSSVPTGELANYPLIGYERFSGLGRFTSQFYKDQNLSVNILCECPDENAIAALVAENFGIGLVASVDALAHANVEIRPLADLHLGHTVYMGYLKDHYQIPVIRAFIQFVKKNTVSI